MKAVERAIGRTGGGEKGVIFPGQMNRHHWPFDDPAHAKGTEAEQFTVFQRVRDEIQRVFSAYAAGRLDALKG